MTDEALDVIDTEIDRDRALAFEAPYLIEKLLKERIADSHEDAVRLFREAKRYIYLVRTDETTAWDMWSLRIDEAWHQFVLFTNEYIEYSFQFYSGYVPHSPSNAPAPPPAVAAAFEAREVGTFAAFAARYEELFGEMLPDEWYDERSVHVNRRVVNYLAGDLHVQRSDDEEGLVDLRCADGDVLLSVSDVAVDALRYVASTGAFYVRELPGLEDEEKVAIVATLVEYGLLRVAP
jgi:hypothetical protein